jgi:hypothetical protein
LAIRGSLFNNGVFVYFYLMMYTFIKEVILQRLKSEIFQHLTGSIKQKGMILRRTISRLVNINLFTIMLIIGFSSLPGISQSLGRIKMENIPQRKVRKYIVSREIDQLQDFTLIHPSWKKEINESNYSVNEKIFFLKYELSKVWESYRHANPLKMWNGHSFRLGLMISKYSNSVIYVNSSCFPEVDTGQVYFLNLRFMKGIFNVPVAFEIINISNINQLVEISYIDNNKSKGEQTIQFSDNGDGSTRIVHRSYFKSDSWFRESLLYPYFHKKFVKEFHRNMRQLIKNDNLNSSALQ